MVDLGILEGYNMTLAKKSLYSLIAAAVLFCCFVLLSPKANAANTDVATQTELQSAVDAAANGRYNNGY